MSDREPSAPSTWCRSLRWKGYPVDREDPARVAAVFAAHGEVYSCLKTAQPIGWDDGVVDPGRCDEARSCYQPHPLLQLRRGARPLV